ncbi:MAG: HAD family hydrolase [Planctomycetota bacterium]|nr:HAD family hydrolase [Planctomycetota bacterium]
MSAAGEKGTYRGLGLDLDGTLLDAEGALPEKSVAALRRLRDQSVQIVLLSGRMTPAVMPFWRQIGLDTPIVAYNGAKIILPAAPPLYEAVLPNSLICPILAFCRHRGLHLNIYIRDRLYALTDTEIGRWYADYYRVPLEILPPGWADDCAPITKMLVIASDSEVFDLYQQMQALFGDSAHITTSSRRFVEILPQGVNKGAALRCVADYLRLPLHAWVAVGDGANDVEMIAAAGYGIAVSEGDEAAKAVAKQVVPPLAEGGWRKIEELFA